jgi:tetratricopeptide (TPR) repeat protein
MGIRFFPDLFEFYLGLGIVYVQLGKYKDAIEPVKRAIELNPKSSGAYFTLGMAYANLKRYTEAVEAFKQALKIDPRLCRCIFTTWGGLYHT